MSEEHHCRNQQPYYPPPEDGDEWTCSCGKSFVYHEEQGAHWDLQSPAVAPPTASDTPSRAEEIAREAALVIWNWKRYELCSLEEQITKAITAAIAPLEARIDTLATERNNRVRELEAAQTNSVNLQSDLTKAREDAGRACREQAGVIASLKGRLVTAAEEWIKLEQRLAMAEAENKRLLALYEPLGIVKENE